MGFLKKLFPDKMFSGKKFSIWKKKKEEDTKEREAQEEREVLRRDSINLREREQRVRYVESCLEQIRDAEVSISQLTREYGMVTSYLTDMEEIEALPEEERKELCEVAESITEYEKEKSQYETADHRLTEADFKRIERMEEEIKEGVGKLTEAEEFQEKIQQDMRRLSAEKHAYQYRKHDLKHIMVNMRGMLIIVCFAFLTCMILLFLLDQLLGMEVGIGYLLSGVSAAFAAFLIYMKYMDASREKKKVERAINRLILLHNRVKIRYVNNTNLLDYLHMKYSVTTARELADMWEAYQKEIEERERFRELHAELDFQRRELMAILRRYQIKNPEIWLHQAEAISRPKEMVEIRHSLILRRQKLRKQMEYNEHLAESAQMEVRALAEEFPEYASEIMEMISGYEVHAD